MTARVLHPTTFGEAAPVMFENGYQPIPLEPATKTPIMAGWSALNRAPWATDALASEVRYNARAACGWAVGPQSLAVDLDITDSDIAAEAADIAVSVLGDTPLIRIGLEPKRLLIYRTDGSVRSAKINPLEMFAGSGQIAVFGWHQKAGRPYFWPRASLLELHVDSHEVPLVDIAVVQRFRSRVGPLLRPHQRGAATRRGGSVSDAHARLNELERRLGWQRAVARLCEEVIEGGRHPALYAIISTAHRRGRDEEELLRVLRRHAPDLLDYVGEEYLQRTLDQFYGRELPEAPEWVQKVLASTHNLETGRPSR